MNIGTDEDITVVDDCRPEERFLWILRYFRERRSLSIFDTWLSRHSHWPYDNCLWVLNFHHTRQKTQVLCDCGHICYTIYCTRLRFTAFHAGDLGSDWFWRTASLLFLKLFAWKVAFFPPPGSRRNHGENIGVCETCGFDTRNWVSCHQFHVT